MKISVLHIIKSLGRGGAEMLLQETLPFHNQDAFEFHYIYFLPWKNQMVAGIAERGGLISNFSAKNNHQILLQYKKVAAYCTQHKIDIIHCHLPWAGFLGRMLYKHTKIPVLYTEHNKQERYHSLTRLINKYTFNAQTMCIPVSDDVAQSIRKNIQPHIPLQTIVNG